MLLSLFLALLVQPGLLQHRDTCNDSTRNTCSDPSTLSRDLPNLPVLAIRRSKAVHPTGDPMFEVMQPFPSGFGAEETDPFLMCDHYDYVSKGVETDPDKFPIAWHPHRGMDILSYIISGRGRHADSLGHRQEFESPGMQWISVGSGVEHAEGGGTPMGERLTGFQIWINVPSSQKMKPPRYGTEPPENIPIVDVQCADDEEANSLFTVQVRLLAGELNGRAGPFRTVTDVRIVDYFHIPFNSTILHAVLPQHDNCLVFAYKGSGVINDAQPISQHDIVRMDVGQWIELNTSRQFSVTSTTEGGISLLIFDGKRLNQEIAWHGPFVMTTQSEIQQTLRDYRRGKFPVERVEWDYKRTSTRFA